MKSLKTLLIAIAFMTAGMVGFNVQAAENTAEPTAEIKPTPGIADDMGIGTIDTSTEKIITSGNYQYVILNEAEKTIALRKISNYGETVEIPEQIDGYTVKVLGYYLSGYSYQTAYLHLSVFHDYASNTWAESSTIKKLVIPESVKYIGYNACANLFAMTELVLPEYVNIDYGAFMGASSLTRLELKNVSWIGYDAFTDVNLDELNFIGSWEGGDELSIKGKIKKIIASPGNSPTVFSTNGMSNPDDLYINKGISKLSISEGIASKNNVYIYDKKTEVSLDHSYINESEIDICKRIITCKGAKAVKFAKKNKVNYTTVSEPKEIKAAVKKDKKGYTYSWKKSYVKRTDYTINKKGKWKIKNSKKKASYDIYVKKAGKYQLVMTTKKTKYNIKTKKKVKIVVSDRLWKTK